MDEAESKGYIFADFPKLIVVISFSALVLSAIHEWAFFSVVGMPYLTTASPADYLTSTLSWLPLALGAVTATAVIHKTIPNIFRQSRKRILMFYFFSAIFLFTIAIIIRSFHAPKFSVVMLIALMFLFMAVSLFYLRDRPIAENSYFYCTTLVVMMTFVVGLDEGSLSKKPEQIQLIALKDLPEMEAYVLRNFDKGLIVEIAQSGRIAFYPWTEIRSLSDSIDRKARPTFACSLIKSLC